MLTARISGKVDLPPALAGLAASAEKEFTSALRRALKLVGDDIRRRIQEESALSSGEYFRSIKYEMFDERGSVRGRVFSTAAHAVWIENGRRPGKQPPVEVIEQWMLQKGMEADASIAFLIARAIGKRGIPARPFFHDAIVATADEVHAIFQRAAKRLARRLKGAQTDD